VSDIFLSLAYGAVIQREYVYRNQQNDDEAPSNRGRQQRAEAAPGRGRRRAAAPEAHGGRGEALRGLAREPPVKRSKRDLEALDQFDAVALAYYRAYQRRGGDAHTQNFRRGLAQRVVLDVAFERGEVLYDQRCKLVRKWRKR
jgi:hypothetical protein